MIKGNIEMTLWIYTGPIDPDIRVTKSIFLPYVPRQGETVILQNDMDAQVIDIFLDLDNQSIGVILELADLTQDKLDWLVENANWKLTKRKEDNEQND